MFLVLVTLFKDMTKAWLVSLGKENIPFHKYFFHSANSPLQSKYSKTCLTSVPIFMPMEIQFWGQLSCIAFFWHIETPVKTIFLLRFLKNLQTMFKHNDFLNSLILILDLYLFSKTYWHTLKIIPTKVLSGCWKSFELG